MEIIRYSYGNSKWAGPLCVLACPPLVWFFAKQAHDHEPFDYKGMHLDPPNAVYVHWGFAALFVFLGILGVIRVIEQFNGQKKFIEVTAYGIDIPKMTLAEKASYRFEDIISLSEMSLRGKRYLTIKTRYGRTTLADVTFSNKADYDEVYGLLRSKTPSLKTDNSP